MEKCVKLKFLDINAIEDHDDEIDWPNRNYPTLECLKLSSFKYKRNNNIVMFLEINPNIRKFIISDDILLKHQALMLNAKIGLDVLSVTLSNCWKEILDLLNELYMRGFYKKLHLNFEYLIKHPEIFNHLAKFDGLVGITLHMLPCDSVNRVSALQNLRELGVQICLQGVAENITNFETIATNLINLKSIRFDAISIDALMPFIQRSVSMQMIRIRNMKTGLHFNAHTKVIDLLALDRARKQLALNKQRDHLMMTPQKITLYVEEFTDDIYLATKWAMNGNDFEFIQLKRAASYKYDWGYEFNL